MTKLNLKDFGEFLTESGDYLDISIQAAGKYLTSNKRIEEFLSKEVLVEHKLDGIKLQVLKIQDNGDLSDWIFAYKGNILYQEEYDYQPNTRARSEAIGSSQFKIAIEHFQKLGKTSLPVGTELFIEYLMRKPTLSSNYSQHHKMVLIGTSKSKYSVNFGKLKTQNSGLVTNNRDGIAKELKIDVPQILFKGFLGSERQFQAGIKNSNLDKIFQNHKMSMNWDNPELLIDDIRNIFLEVESKYGGKEEGVVLIQGSLMLKFQQSYQIDPVKRRQIKLAFANSSPELETKYWENVNASALQLADKVGTSTDRNLPMLLKTLSTELKYIRLSFTHEKKTEANIKDDIQLTAKNLIIKNLKGNNNCLILGKFRVLTTGHAKMIRRAQRDFDKVVVCIVTSSDTKDTKDLRTEMIKKTFPSVEIIHHNSGNLLGIFNKSPININAVYAGSDRVSDYVKQLQRTNGVGVREMPRTDSAISATKVISEIQDYTFFVKNTPKEIHSSYDELLQVYGD